MTPLRRLGRAGLGLALLATLLTGCNAVGPRTIRGASFDYNEAIAHSWNQQLLLNLVRLRYRDSPYFLRVTSVTTQYVLEASAGLDQTFVGGSESDPTAAGVGVEYTERPTVTYLPVQGEEFARQLLLPVSLESLFLLTQSGWSAKQVLSCCVERVGDLRNAAALGSTPADSIVDFHRVGELLQYFRRGSRLDVAIMARGRVSTAACNSFSSRVIFSYSARGSSTKHFAPCNADPASCIVW